MDDDARQEPDPAKPPADERAPRRRLSVWSETLILLATALVLSFLVKTFLVQAFYIPSGSMEPGLEVNDRILVQKASYWRGTPERGDTIVFEDPGGWLGPGEDAGPTTPVATALGKIGLYPTGGHLVKRVIGVAGDVIECCDDDGRLLVNGEPLGRGFTKNPQECDGPMVNDCQSDWSAGPVPEGYLFVMGDHRNASADSSVHLCRKDETDCVPGAEFVPTDLVVGKVFARVWPADRFSILDTPETFNALD
ncbi:signal peptidase I [Nocardioides dongkuii]|uniref:signal peptidase I n=1 Tax=Nocardioides dongkuii TaxID=2760089 RepID=UPI001FD5F181|nr:signal peptidase I [Nocardioides dongkuii]